MDWDEHGQPVQLRPVPFPVTPCAREKYVDEMKYKLLDRDSLKITAAMIEEIRLVSLTLLLYIFIYRYMYIC